MIGNIQHRLSAMLVRSRTEVRENEHGLDEFLIYVKPLLGPERCIFHAEQMDRYKSRTDWWAGAYGKEEYFLYFNNLRIERN